jgi:predicted transposase/invertase (TIGR01784 family)
MKLAKAIEESVGEWPLDEVDITTLLERLSGIVEYVGKGYRTTEVQEMINTSLMGYGKVLLMEGEKKGEKKGRRKGKREGKREGEQKKAREVARNFKKMGMPLEQIAQGTGLSPEDIAKL